jgi:hypothetical protein
VRAPPLPKAFPQFVGASFFLQICQTSAYIVPVWLVTLAFPPMEKALFAEQWRGQIPCVFSLDSEEITTLATPKPLYVRAREYG